MSPRGAGCCRGCHDPPPSALSPASVNCVSPAWAVTSGPLGRWCGAWGCWVTRRCLHPTRERPRPGGDALFTGHRGPGKEGCGGLPSAGQEVGGGSWEVQREATPHHAALQSRSAQTFLPRLSGPQFLSLQNGLQEMAAQVHPGPHQRATFGEWPTNKHSCHRPCYDFRLGSGGNSLHP